LKAKGKKRDGGGAIVKPKRIGEMKNTISKSSSKRKVNASSRATDRQIARDIAARSKPATAKPAAANKISRSPRQLNKDEKIARDVMTDKRFKSDRQRVTEMQRRGVKPGTDVVGLVANVRSKQGGGTTSKIKPAVLNDRDAATARLKIKTATRRKLKADRSSVIPANPKARRVQSARIGSTVAKKARAKGNAPATIANRVKRKAAVNKTNLRNNTRYGNAVDSKQYGRQIKTSMTLDRAQNFLKTGKLPGKDNSIKAQRAFKAANARINANRAARRADRAEANIPMKGRRGKQLDASISKAAKQVKAAETARLMKPKAQIKSERAAKAEAKRQVAAAKPKRVRSAESLRVSRAKRITKERSISLNPAGNTQKGAGRMAANAKRTQDRALAFYKGKAKPAAAKPAAAKRSGAVGKISEAKAGRIVARMDAQRGRKALPGRRNANFVRTYERSRQFILKPSTAALKKGKPISVNESVQKAVANAAKRRKPKRRRS
jgi:hypothetical protein